MKWLIRQQSLLFIEFIQSWAENEDETKNENDHENENEDENQNDEIENKQYRNKFNVNIKRNDVKDENVFNRFCFMRLKNWKETSLFERNFFFRNANLIKRIVCSNRNKWKNKRNVLFDRVNKCQDN
jgi:hypothetical protein